MWSHKFNLTVVFLGLAGTAPLLSGCYPGGDLSAMTQSHMITDAEEAPAGHTCTELSSPGSSGTGDTSSDFWIRESTDRKGVQIEWGALDETLGSRSFDRDFLESGEVERFIITEPSGQEHSYMAWGATGCERCPADYEFEALPGDPWGCGLESTEEPSGPEPTTPSGDAALEDAAAG